MATLQRDSGHHNGRRGGNYGHEGERKGREGYGKGDGCPKLDCCAELLAQLGAPDPLDANIYDLIDKIVNNNINIDLDVDVPLPAFTYYVSPEWTPDDINTDRQFTSLQAAINATDPAFEYTIIVHAGAYPAVTLTPNIVLKADARALIAGITYVAPDTPGPQELRIFDVEIAGDVLIDTTAKTDAAPVNVLFARVAFAPGFAFTSTLRSGASGAALTASDAVVIRESDLARSTLDVTTVGGNFTIAQFIILNSRVTISGVANLTGTAIQPALGLKGKRVTKTVPTKGQVIRKTAPRASSSRSSRVTVRRPNFVQRAIVPTGNPVYSLYFEAANIDIFEVYSFNITNANTLLENVFFAAQADEDVIITVTSGVLNASDVNLNSDVFLALNGGVASLMHCGYDEAQLSSLAGGAADRDVTIGESDSTALALAGAFGLAVTHNVPYVTDDYVASVIAINAALVAATLTLPVATVNSNTNVEVALSSVAFTTPLRYVLNQRASPLTFI